MAGLRHELISHRAHHFAESLLERAYAQDLTWGGIAFGSGALLFGQYRHDTLGTFISSAFLPAQTDSIAGTLAVARHEDVALTSTEWARSWINSGAPIPSTFTYPYRIHFDRVAGNCYVLDQRDARAAVWVRQVTELDQRAFVTPFRIMLSWLGNLSGREIVHASAALVDGHGVAFSGPSGSGKSTLALALGLSGHPVISDDCVIIEQTVMYPAYGRAKVDESSRRSLGIDDSVVVRVPGTSDAKGIITLPSLGLSPFTSARLDAWAFPKVAGSPARYTLRPQQAHRELVRDSLREVIGGSTRNRVRLARSIAERPAFRLLLGPDMAANVALIKAVVHDQRRPSDRSDATGALK